MNMYDYLNFWYRIGSRYFMVAAISFFIFYILKKKKWNYKKIQRRIPGHADYRREIMYSLITVTLFAFVPTVILKTPAIAKHTSLYREIGTYGWLYFMLYFPMMFLMHDTYFYWTHRLMHHKKLFRLFHLVHHRSTNPSPWAAYSFHPLEALAEAGIFVIFLFSLPIHLIHLLVFFFLMIVYNVYGHLGFELYPGGFPRSRIGKWINTSVSHNQHHQYFTGNYGLYFTIWDRLMGTLRPDYEEGFDRVKAARNSDKRITP